MRVRVGLVCIAMMGAATLGGVLLAQEPPPPAASADGENTSDGNDAKTTFTVLVEDVPSGEKVEDFHIESFPNDSFPKPDDDEVEVDPDPDTSNDEETWKVKKSNGGRQLHVYANSSSDGFSPDEDGNVEITFTIDWEDDADELDLSAVKWKVTSGGKMSPDEDDVLDEGKTAEEVIDVWVAKVLIDGPPPVVAATTTLTAATNPGRSGASYAIYSSTTVAPNYDDALGIGIYSQASPVPSSWNLTFSEFTGTIGSSGSPQNTPTITVPNDSSLIGETLFVVFALLDANGDVDHVSPSFELTIQP